MASLGDKDFGNLWREHFWERADEPSRQICLLIDRIVRGRAIAERYALFPERLARVLDDFGIPRDQFEMFEKEQKDKIPPGEQTKWR